MNYSNPVKQSHSFNFRQIRLLIDQAFSDSEFAEFCFDNFYEKYSVARNFNLERSCRIMELIEHCDRNGQLDKLLDLTKAYNPFQYEKHYPYKFEEAHQNVVSQKKKIQSPQTVTIALTINLDWETWENMLGRDQDIIKSIFQFAIASETNIQPNQINVLAASRGSVKLEMEIPREAFIELLSKDAGYLQSEFGIERIERLTENEPKVLVSSIHKLKHENVNLEVRKVLASLTQERGEEYSNLISSIIWENLEKGRIEYYLEKNPNRGINDYIAHVTKMYDEYHHIMHQIQQERSEKIWVDLFEKLERWSYGFLLRKGFQPGQETLTLAHEYAIESAIAILQAYFPYDTQVDAWLQQIVIYTCSNQIEAWKRQQVVKKRLHQTLDAENPLKTSTDSLLERVFLENERSTLYSAIQQLKNPKMRQVVWLRYFGEFSSQEIAEFIGSSNRYVDKLHWQAKQLLGKILTDEIAV